MGHPRVLGSHRGLSLDMHPKSQHVLNDPQGHAVAVHSHKMTACSKTDHRDLIVGNYLQQGL